MADVSLDRGMKCVILLNWSTTVRMMVHPLEGMTTDDEELARDEGVQQELGTELLVTNVACTDEVHSVLV